MRSKVAVLLLLVLPATPAGQAVLVAGAGLNEPFAVDFDRAGNAYIAEMGGNRVSVLDRNGKLSVFAGTGEKGFGGDGGPGARALFNGPHHLLMGPDDRLYVADTWNNRVRGIDLRTGVVTGVAGTGERGFDGDGGPAIRARFGGIYSIALRGRVLYACDLDNRRVMDPPDRPYRASNRSARWSSKAARFFHRSATRALNGPWAERRVKPSSVTSNWTVVISTSSSA
jgi:hypothetical protein